MIANAVRLIFALSYAALVAAQSRRAPCSRNITGETEGIITSPGYPERNYPANQNCIYIISVPENNVIVYSIDFMELEDPDEMTNECLFDYLRIYDGGVRIHSLCGKDVLYPNGTSSNQLRIEFTSDFSTEGQGFELKWYTMDLDKRPIKLHCNFDDPIPLCAGWKNKNSDYQWSFIRGHTVSANTGPEFDHTTGSERGRYAFIEASGATRGSTAVLESPAILSQLNAEKRCVSLWYHMYGGGMGALRIFLVGRNEKRTMIAEYIGDKGDDWHRSNNTIILQSLMSTISIEASRGTSFASDIAIDDIKITEGDCVSGARSITIQRPPIAVLPSTSMRLPGSLFPQTCAANLEAASCPEDCDATCGNFFTLSCTRACYHNCACPESFPIFHEGRCVDLTECPNDVFSGILFNIDFNFENTTKAEAITTPSVTTTPDTTITPEERSPDVTTTPDTTMTPEERTTTQTEAAKTTANDLERKKQVIHDAMLHQIRQGILSFFSNQKDDPN